MVLGDGRRFYSHISQQQLLVTAALMISNPLKGFFRLLSTVVAGFQRVSRCNSGAQECFKSVNTSYQCPTGQGKSHGQKKTSELDILDMLSASQFT